MDDAWLNSSSCIFMSPDVLPSEDMVYNKLGVLNFAVQHFHNVFFPIIDFFYFIFHFHVLGNIRMRPLLLSVPCSKDCGLITSFDVSRISFIMSRCVLVSLLLLSLIAVVVVSL